MVDPDVRTHLHDVAATLRRETPADLDPAVAARRRRLLGELERYARRGRFPRPDGPVTAAVRTVSPPRAFAGPVSPALDGPLGPGARAPIFEDRHGRRCAVGHLVGLDRPDLVAAVRQGHNGSFLPEIASPELDGWAAHHGFTRDELAWIQPTYLYTIEKCGAPWWEVPSPPAIPYGQCDGPDATLIGPLDGLAISCQVCNGPLQVWVSVENVGSEDATDVRVTLGADDTLFDTAILTCLAPGEVVTVALLAPDVASMSRAGWVRIASPDGCESTTKEFYPWGEPGGTYPTYFEPEGCPAGTTNTGGVSTPTTTPGACPDEEPQDTATETDPGDPEPGDDKGDEGGCGCGAGGVGTLSPAGLVALLGIRRSRRVRRSVPS